MPRYLTSYPSRLQSGSTSLLTPNLSSFKHLEVPPSAPFDDGRRPGNRARPSYRDRDSSEDDERPTKRRGGGGGGGESPEREDVEVDDRGFVISVPPLDPDSDEAIGKFRYRQPGWIRVRSDYILERACRTEDNLIPVRLDLDINGEYRLKDVFLWNLNEELITPTEFAINLVTDLNLPVAFVNEIARDIRKQLSEYSPVALTDLPFSKSAENDEKTAPVVVGLEVHLSRHLITDKFEWDLCNTHAIESFVRTTCADLGLFGEFNVALSCAIREQLMRLKKEVIESPHGLAGLVDVQNDCAYDDPAGIRVCPETLGLEWVPSIEILTREEIEKRDNERDRIVRRLRRDTSRFSMLNHTSTTPTTTNTTTSTTTSKRGRARATRDACADSPDQITEIERQKWRCSNCRISGPDSWDIRGPKMEYCHHCGKSATIVADSQLPQAQQAEEEEKLNWRRGLYSTRYLINNPNWSGR